MTSRAAQARAVEAALRGDKLCIYCRKYFPPGKLWATNPFPDCNNNEWCCGPCFDSLMASGQVVFTDAGRLE